MGRGAESVALDQDLVAGFYVAGDQGQVDCSRTGRQANDGAVEGFAAIRFAVGEVCEVFFEGVDVGAHRDYPVGIEGFFYVLLFPAFF